MGSHIRRPPTHEGLHVCGTCFGLRGARGDRIQLCGCASEEEYSALAEASYRHTGSYWTRLAAICHCCGAEVVDASHKFTRWFCPPCFELAREVNDACGRCAFPVGWHSILNSVFVNANRCKTLPGATAAADQLTAFFREAVDMGTWSRHIVDRQWQRATLPRSTDVAVDDYLDAVWSVGVDKAALFDELITARGIPLDWRGFEDLPLELLWRPADDGSLVTNDTIVWTWPDGVAEHADLTLRIHHIGDDAWTWTILIEEQAVGEGDAVLATDTVRTVEEAKTQCELAALRLIDRQERLHGDD